MEATSIKPIIKRKDGKSSNSPKKNVKFVQQSENQYYDNEKFWECELTHQWYHEEDFVSFRMRTRELARNLRAIEYVSANPISWSRSLLRVYMAFQQAKSVEQIMNILETTKVKLNPQFVGVDGLVIAGIENDRSRRRDELLQDVQLVQRMSFPRAMDRAGALRRASLRHSRATCMYSRYVAHVAAELL